ncbi:MAG: type IV secretion system protein [Acidithiobacillus sp.]|nr:type IV secretion system protein [Acidithiobacillus sp.]
MSIINTYLKTTVLVLLVFVSICIGTAKAAPVTGPVTGQNPQAVQLQVNIQNAPPTANTATGDIIVGNNNHPINYTKYASIIHVMQQTGVTMADRFVPDAEVLTGILGGLGFTWLGIMIMLSQADVWHMGLRPIFILVIYIGITLAMLEYYSAFSGDVVDGFIYSAGVLTGTTPGSGFSVVYQMFSTLGSIESALIHSLNPHFLSGPTEIPHNIVLFFTTLYRAFQNVGIIVPMILMMMIIAFLFGMLFITFQIVIAVAIAVGPVFIPFLVLPITRFLFEGWLKFLIMSGIYYLAAVVVASLIGTGMLTFANNMVVMGTTLQGQKVNIGMAYELLMFEFVGVMAMFMVPSFAHAMAGSVNLSGLDAGGGAAKIAKKVGTKGLA